MEDLLGFSVKIGPKLVGIFMNYHSYFFPGIVGDFMRDLNEKQKARIQGNFTELISLNVSS